MSSATSHCVHPVSGSILNSKGVPPPHGVTFMLPISGVGSESLWPCTSADRTDLAAAPPGDFERHARLKWPVLSHPKHTASFAGHWSRGCAFLPHCGQVSPDWVRSCCPPRLGLCQLRHDHNLRWEPRGRSGHVNKYTCTGKGYRIY